MLPEKQQVLHNRPISPFCVAVKQIQYATEKNIKRLKKNTNANIAELDLRQAVLQVPYSVKPGSFVMIDRTVRPEEKNQCNISRH